MNTQAEDKLHLNLCQKIQEVKSAFRAKHIESVEIFDTEIQKRRREYQHLLDLEKLKFEIPPLNKLVLDFLPIMVSYDAFDQEEIKIFFDNVENLRLRELVFWVLHQDWQGLKTLSAQYLIGTGLLLFIGLNLAQAVLEIYAEKLKPQVDQENWLLGNCPVCGNLPAMEMLRKEDSKRILWCGWCGTEWHFKRLVCPFCGNDDHNSLRYFFVEESSTPDNAAFRVDVCDRCKTYIKTLDERELAKSEKRDLYAENLNTVYLDVLAQKDGYQSPTYWMVTLSPEDSLI